MHFSLVVLCLLSLAALPASAQPRGAMLRYRLSAPAVADRIQPRAFGEQYLRSFGGGVLGAALGGGLGYLVGFEASLCTLTEDDRNDCGPDQRGEDQRALAVAGFLLGGSVGALAAGGREIDGPVVLAAGLSGLLGMVGGGLAGSVLTGAHPVGIALGAGLGAPAGAALGATAVWRHAGRSGLLTRSDGRWRVALPKVRRIRLAPSGASVRSVVLLYAQL